MALPAGLGSSASGAEGGQIAGKVIGAATKAALEGIEVCAFQESPEFTGECAKTSSSGEYTITGLPPGEYVVEFASPFEGGLNYVTQYYNGSASPEGARLVHVLAGKTVTAIDAELQEGGHIAGRVTDASTSAPIGQAMVCAFAPSFESGGCAPTNASGEYSIAALGGGVYDVAFYAPGYTRQYFAGKSSISEAQGVTVTAGAVTAGIDAAMAPENSTAPGVTLPTLGGEKSQTGLSTTPGGSTSKAPLLTLSTTKIVISGRSAFVHLECKRAPCKGSGELVVRLGGKRHKGKGAPPDTETLVLAKGPFAIKQGESAIVALHLTLAGRRKLAHAKRHPIAAALTLSIEGAKTTTKPVLAS